MTGSSDLPTPRTRPIVVGLVSVAGLVLFSWLMTRENAAELALHPDRSARLDHVLGARGQTAILHGLGVFALVSLFLAPMISGPERFARLGWILLANLVSIGILGSVLMFEFVRAWPLR